MYVLPGTPLQAQWSSFFLLSGRKVILEDNQPKSELAYHVVETMNPPQSHQPLPMLSTPSLTVVPAQR